MKPLASMYVTNAGKTSVDQLFDAWYMFVHSI